MDADLDTLATALYVTTDDLLKGAPHLAPWRPAVGITPKLTDAELVTLAVLQALLGFSLRTAGCATPASTRTCSPSAQAARLQQAPARRHRPAPAGHRGAGQRHDILDR